MERNRSKKAKAFGASGRKSVNNKQHREAESQETYLKKARPLLIPDRSLIRKDISVHRFQQSAAVSNSGFTTQMGHDQFLVVTSAAGAAVSTVDAWRIRRITFYAVPQSGSSTALGFTDTSTDGVTNMRNDPEKLYLMTARSQDGEKMTVCVGKNSSLGGWKFTSNVNIASSLFALNVVNSGTGNAQVTMDIEFETLLNLVGLPLGYGTTTLSTVVGAQGGRNVLGGAMVLIGINNLG